MVIDIHFANHIKQNRYFMQARALLADDEISKEILAEFLAVYDLHIDLCETGLEACTMARKNNYDIIFMDIAMPDMNGLDATRYIREHLPSEQQPIIIASTGNEVITRKGKEQLFMSGFNDYIFKPYSQQAVIDVVNDNLLGAEDLLQADNN